jgi:hypothetical protein
MMALTISVVSIPIVMFPILRKQNESLALGYIGARIFEGFSDFLLAINPLILVTLSQEYEEAGAPGTSYYQTMGALIRGLYDSISILENIPYCLGALIFFYLLYQSQLVPRWLSVWGLLGAILFLVTVPFRLSTPIPEAVIFALPLVVCEMVLAIWLIVRGFNSSEITFESAKQI